MSVIKIDNFGGELPSVSPRALPANGAQENRNLYLGTSEFRPLAQDTSVASTANGTRTLHRFARDASGNFNTNPSTGWITSTQERSYVKGQINDERTERTYLTFDDGSARPRVIDATGADRLLGVPRPASLAVSANITDELTSEEASNFLYGEAAEAIRAAIVASAIDPGTNEPNSRRSGSTILGGPYSKHGLFFNNEAGVPSFASTLWWVLVARVSVERATTLGLDYNRLSAVSDGTNVWIPINALPYIWSVNTTQLQTKLREIQYPEGSGEKSGTQLLEDAKISSLVEQVTKGLDPSTFAKSLRDDLDGTVREFARLLTSATVSTVTAKPVEPTKPTTAEWDYSGEGGPVRSQAWVDYDNAMKAYREQMDAYERSAADNSLSQAEVLNRLLELQSKAATLTRQIEEASNRQYSLATGTTTSASSWIDSIGGVSGVIGETVTRIIDTRFYIATFVTDWGEESAPCKPSDLVEVDQNDSVTITRPVPASGETFASRHITKWRLYRSNSGSETAAFQFVAELPIATTTYTDDKKAEELGEVCPTLTWDEPPYRADLQFDGFPPPVVGTNPFLRGLVGMPNGIMAGFFDNTVAFCEPYVPYAWPVEYQITTEFPIVGLGVFGQTLFVGTTGNPYFISGADSASMSAQKLDARQACVSRRSIASVQGGVLYASPDGLCVADPSGVKVVTLGLFTREDWQKLDPASMIAASHENIYYLFYTGQGGGCLTFDLASGKLGRVDLRATATYTDTLTDTLYIANGSSIQAVFGSAARRTGRWRSGRVPLQAQVPFAWLKVYGDQSASAPVTVRWYGDGVLRHTATITDINPVRLPPGRWLEHEVEVESAARVTRLVMAGNTQELQAV
jgi:hypothetical protein